jgi:sugar phosphate isomerase/epimerase
MTQLTRDDLIASHFTLSGSSPAEPARHPFEARVTGAAAAGFAGIGLLGEAYAQERERGLSDADMRAILDDHGMVVGEVEFLHRWAAEPDDAEAASMRGELEDRVWAMADAFHPRVVSVGEIAGAADLPELDVLAERFGALCDRADAHGLLVALEFMPFTGISDAATAGDIATRAGRANAGINLDSWHHFRGAADEGALAEHADRIFMVQLDDADADVVGELYEDTMLRRRYLGEGSFDNIGLIQLLDEHGVDIPLSVELMSPEHGALDADEAARRAYDTTRTVVDRARHGGVKA